MIACIIPIHGRVFLLDDCIRSIVSQSTRPQEIVVVSDHNTDDDFLAISNIVAVFPGVQLIKNMGTRGASAARNAGVAATSAPYIICTDADVVFVPRAFELMLQALEKNTDTAFAYGDFIVDKKIMRGKEFSEKNLRRENFISTMSLVRRSAFPGYDETLRRFQDWDLWLTIAARGGRGVYIPEVLFETGFGGTMSYWIPSVVARHARFFLWWPRVKKYFDARQIIVRKHHLNEDGRA